jgi:hypothetical protein
MRQQYQKEFIKKTTKKDIEKHLVQKFVMGQSISNLHAHSVNLKNKMWDSDNESSIYSDSDSESDGN